VARRDARALRDEASAAAADGKHKRALEAYVELERLEPADPQWPKRAGDMLRKLNKTREAVAAFDRAVDRYAQSGFVVQAIALCRLILQIDPTHSDTARRLADMTEQQSGLSRTGAMMAIRGPADAGGPTQPRAITPVSTIDVGSMADLELELDDGAPRPARPTPPQATAGQAPAARPSSPSSPPARPRPASPPPRASRPSPPPANRSIEELSLDDEPELSLDPPPPRPGAAAINPETQIPVVFGEPSVPAAARVKRPSSIPLRPGAPIDTVRLGRIAAGALERKLPDGSFSGISVIPIDDELELIDDEDLQEVVEPAGADESVDLDISTDSAEVPAVPAHTRHTTPTPSGVHDEIEELSLDEVHDDRTGDGDERTDELAMPRAWSNAARRALAATPLFSGLGHDALEALLTRIGLVTLEPGERLFREGDPGHALYIVAEGEVGVVREGPPRRAIARLGTGAFFGEVALLTEQPRNATVEAIAATQLLTIDRELVATLVADHPDVLFVILRFVRDRLLSRLIDTSPLFAPMAPSDRTALAARFNFLEIEPGTVIIGEGKRADGLYIFLAGRADVRRGDELVRYLGAGDLAGESSILRAQASPTRVAAMTRCLALCLPGSEFREIIMTHPHVLEYVGELAEGSGLGGAALDLI